MNYAIKNLKNLISTQPVYFKALVWLMYNMHRPYSVVL